MRISTPSGGIHTGRCFLRELTWQDLQGTPVCEVGYLFKRRFWHSGYATEAAVACKKYAFARLGQERVYSLIRAGNAPSVAVARRGGMRLCGTVLRHYRGVDMTHLVYGAKRPAPDENLPTKTV